ncbi:MAG: hypothetical protein ACI9SC_001294, partial [Gammaproteobacteria bacterium]
FLALPQNLWVKIYYSFEPGKTKLVIPACFWRRSATRT